jgi:hypothetical protein
LLLDQFFVYLGDILEYYLSVGLRCLLVLGVNLVLICAHVVQVVSGNSPQNQTRTTHPHTHQYQVQLSQNGQVIGGT